ncbi:MAG: PKD domain-containing protein [Bacteroidia bacterium]|nr:PKD domain-containing protein [Bacteroidia bacterium]
MKPGLRFLFLILISSKFTIAQTCTILPSNTKVCIGQSVTFNRTPFTSADSAYLWNFGNGSSSTQSGPIYQYPQAGNYIVTLRIYKKGGLICNALPITIRVFTRPQANFVIAPSKNQCFKNNSFVFNDQSAAGGSKAPIKRRTTIFGDGALLQQNAPYSGSFNHSYADTNQAKYNVVLEVEDTNGCVAQKFDTVQVYSKIQASYTVNAKQNCGFTTALFTNTSFVETDGLTATWLFGNGQSLTNDTANSMFLYTYYGDGIFYPRLVIKDKYGCSDSSAFLDSVISFVPDSIINISVTDKRCFAQNKFSFSNSTSLSFDGAYAWTFYTIDGSYQQDSLKRYIDNANFPWCGDFKVLLRFNYDNCSFRADTQITVYGPKAWIHDTLSIVDNSVQCGAHDTVRFAMRDASCYYLNSNLTYFWDFGDAYAPACTTNTKQGLNLNMNCRYSTDSFDVKHFYKYPDQDCYQVKLAIKDTVRMCADTAYRILRLAYPKANWNTSTNPPTPRVTILSSKCSLRDIRVYFTGLEPACGPEEVWFIPDTSCSPKVWSLFAKSPTRAAWRDIARNEICSNDSIAHFGVVARNGLDALGNPCFDTGYYSYAIYNPFVPLVITQTIADPDLCAPHRVKFYTKDSTRTDIVQITYNFGDGSPLYIKTYLPTDTIIEPVYHTYANNGRYNAKFNYINKDTCQGISAVDLLFGNEAKISVLTPEVCINDYALLYGRLRYVTDTMKYFWSDMERAIIGKEQVYWNYGDDNTWELGKENMKHQYKKAGVYFVKIAYKDSLGTACFDTLQGPQYKVIVIAVKAKPTVTPDSFYCAPAVVTFNDESYAMVGDTIPKPLLMQSRLWMFGEEKGNSILKQPYGYYNQNGLISANLIAQSVHGCVDTATVYFRIIGPTTNFVIVDDTFGCVPFTVKLKNTTGQQLRNWIWYFNDPAGSIYSTRNDSDITFTYNTPGVYKIDLLGEDSITNPTTNETKNCNQRFPHLQSVNDFHPRSITVLPIDTLQLIGPDTVCVDQPFYTQVTGTLHNILTQWKWANQVLPETWPLNTNVLFAIDSAGVFNLKVNPIITSKTQCVVGAQKNITAISPKADFNFKLSNYPEIQFVNQSQGAVRYLWDFGQPNASDNSSTLLNPMHNYGESDLTYKVCLMAFDRLDCMDSVCKIIPIKGSVKIPNVFTPDNNDAKNDAFDIDIEGWQKYELYIYNRWGTLVFEGFKDGIYNDGVNWDGRDKNNGTPCPAGTYFVVFKYKLFTEKEDGLYHGTITLIRD